MCSCGTITQIRGNLKCMRTITYGCNRYQALFSTQRSIGEKWPGNDANTYHARSRKIVNKLEKVSPVHEENDLIGHVDSYN